MTGIFVSRAPAGKPRCARCGRPFMPRKAGDLYGEKCARKVLQESQDEHEECEPGVCGPDCPIHHDDIILHDIPEIQHTETT